MESQATDEFTECGKCHQRGDSVAYQSRCGRGLICQRCNDEEVTQAAKSREETVTAYAVFNA